MSHADFDVVVVGSGAAGLTCATVAQQHGLNCLVVEKAAQFGGTTAYSAGGLWVPCNHHMSGIGQSDSPDEARTYLAAVLGNHYDAELIDAYLESGPEMMAYMEANSHVRFFSVPLSDYAPALPGCKLGRTVLTQEFDGRVLGDWLKKVRLPFRGYVAFGSMQTDPQHMGKFRNAFRTLEGFRFSAGRFAAFLKDYLRFGRGANMANGNALVGRLMRSALDAGVTLWESTPALRLIETDGRISGVVVTREGKEQQILVRRGVVLASGGFGANQKLVEKYMPMAGEHASIAPEGNVGDGLEMAQSVGGAMPAPNPDNGIWAPVSHVRDAAGNLLSKFPHFGPDRGKPGSIIVAPDGKRFGNEAESYQDFVNIMHERKIGTAWLLGDHLCLRSYGMGPVLPAPMPYKQYVKSGYLVRANSIEELAGKIGVPPETLSTTVNDFNRHAAQGSDPEFHRGENLYDNAQGDPEHKPNPNLRPLDHAPFYAIKIHPGNVSSLYGMTTNADAQVLDAEGAVISGLYAIGLDQNSMMKGFYPGGGSSLGPAMAFGYRAALHMSGSN